MVEGKVGLSAAVAAIGASEAPAEAVEQLELLPLRGAAAIQAAEPGIERRGPGRPPGSRNRRTEDWVEFILARYQSPLVALAETYSRDVASLAQELRCERIEAFRLQVLAAKELAPYLHQKLPVAVDLRGKGLVSLVIEASPEVAAMVRGEGGEGENEFVIEGALLPAGNEANQ